MQSWLMTSLALAGAVVVAGCAVPPPGQPVAATTGQAAPRMGQPGFQPAATPDFGSKAYGY
jgi:hypothetical protein